MKCFYFPFVFPLKFFPFVKTIHWVKFSVSPRTINQSIYPALNCICISHKDNLSNVAYKKTQHRHGVVRSAVGNRTGGFACSRNFGRRTAGPCSLCPPWIILHVSLDVFLIIYVWFCNWMLSFWTSPNPKTSVANPKTFPSIYWHFRTKFHFSKCELICGYIFLTDFLLQIFAISCKLRVRIIKM